MAITNLLATSNAIKLDGVTFLSSFSGKPNYYLARRLSQTTRRVQTSCCLRDTSSKDVTSLVIPEAKTSSDSDGIGIVRFSKGKSYLVTGATGFLAKGMKYPKSQFSSCSSKLIFLNKENCLLQFWLRNCWWQVLRLGRSFFSWGPMIKNQQTWDSMMRFCLNISIFNFFFFFSLSLYCFCSTQIIKLGSVQASEANAREFLRSIHESKLIPVVGDIGEEYLGIESEIADMISETIDVIISCGGRTTFDDRCFLCFFLLCFLLLAN